MKRILVFLLLASICFGANEIQIRETTGQTDLYCIVVRNSDMYVWDTSGTPAFAANPTWANCDIALTEHTLIKGLYYTTMPTIAVGKYSVHCYKGASPAATDTFLQGFYMDWSGTTEKTFANVDMGYINGGATNGNNATLSLKRLDIQNDSGSAFYAFSSFGSAVDFYTTAANSAGLSARAATGNFARGIDAYSTAPNGYGIYSHATDAAGRGFRVSGGLSDIDADLIIGTFEGNLTGSVGSLGAQAKLDVKAEAETAISDAALATAAGLAATDANVTLILADTNSLQIDWANGGRLDLLLDSAAAVGTGLGSIAYTYTLTISGTSNPISDCAVWVTTDALGADIVASGSTDDDGEIVFYLDADTYYFWRKKSGYNFTNPETVTVTP